MPTIRLLADDLTGALDSAAAFACSVPVYLDRPPSQQRAGVVAVATPTRDVPPAELPQALAGALDWFGSAGLAFKKVDSLLRGNTFAECAYLARAGRFDSVVFAPAYPAQGRLTVDGRHLVASASASTTVVGSIMAEFAAMGLKATSSAADDPPGWWKAVPAPAVEPRVWVPDVRSEADLQLLGKQADALPSPLWPRRLWCGSAGLAHALAARFDDGAAAGRATPDAAPAPRGAEGLLMLGASHHPVVRRQWKVVREKWPAAIVVREGDVAQFSDACAALEGTFDVAALELSPSGRLAPQDAAALLQSQLEELVRRSRRPAMLLVVGGDTLLGICRATGVEHLTTLPAQRAGWGCARLVGGRWDAAICHSRSGAFGDEGDLDAMLRVVSGRRRHGE